MDVDLKGFRENLDAWRLGRVTPEAVEAALKHALEDPRLVSASHSLIRSYVEAGYITRSFAQRLIGFETRSRALPVTDRTLLRADVTDAETGGGALASAANTVSPAAGAVPAPARGPLCPGMLLAGQYVLEDIVPGGRRSGATRVFRARDLIQQEALERNPYVAIKALKEELRQSPRSEAALYREYRQALHLSHPNIVKVQNFNRDGLDVFMVMELLEGRSLHDVTAAVENRGLPLHEALQIIHGASRGLAYAHRLGVVHSNFKPSNVVLTKENIVKVLDFSRARVSRKDDPAASGQSGDLDDDFDACARPESISVYASAEQFAGAPPDPRDDVYALAVVAYELLTGRHPFDRKNAVAAREAGSRPRPVQGLSRRQWRTLQAALSFHREQRPLDAEAFSVGLSPKRRSAALLAAATVALLLLAGAAAVLTVSIVDRVRADRIAAALSSSDPNVGAEAVRQLSDAGNSARAAVLSRDGTKAAVMSVFQRRARDHFDPAANLLDYAGATASLALARRLLPDYAPLRDFEELLDRERTIKLEELSAAFEKALGAYFLRDDQGPAALPLVRADIQALDPANGLLRDGRVPLAYRAAAADAWARSDAARTDALLREGLKVAPEDPGLNGFAADLRRERDSRSTVRSAAELESSIARLGDRNAQLADFRATHEDLDRLQALSPADAVLRRAQVRLQAVMNAEVNGALERQETSVAQALLGEFQAQLDLDFVRGKQSAFDKRIGVARSQELQADEMRRQVDQLLAARRADDVWVADLQSVLAKLARVAPRDPKIAEARADAGGFLIYQARTLSGEARFNEAQRLLSAAQVIGVAPAEVQPELDAVRRAQERVDTDNKNKTVAEKLAVQKQQVLQFADAGVDRLDQAFALYEHLLKEIPAGDTWSTTDGPRALAEGSLRRAQALADAGQFVPAQSQARKIRSLPLSDPYYDARLIFFDRLAGLQSQLQSGDMAGATQTADDLKRGDGRSYAALEPLFAKIISDRIKRLASSHRDEATRLTEAARNLFPKQEFGVVGE